MTTKTRTQTIEPDVRAEAMVAAEHQLVVDRGLALETLALLGENIAQRRIGAVSQNLARLSWLEHRITQTEMMASPLWCFHCAASGTLPAEYPGNPWMVFECVDHAEDQIARSAKSWQRSLFAEVGGNPLEAEKLGLSRRKE